MREIERIIGEALGEASVEFMSREERGVDIVMPTEVLAVIRDKTVKEIQSQIQQTEKAFGGCTKCYGKGFNTEMKGDTIAYGDFEGEKDRIIRGGGVKINYCDCDRGKQIKKMIDSQIQQRETLMIEKMKKIIEWLLTPIFIINTYDDPYYQYQNSSSGCLMPITIVVVGIIILILIF